MILKGGVRDVELILLHTERSDLKFEHLIRMLPGPFQLSVLGVSNLENS